MRTAIPHIRVAAHTPPSRHLRPSLHLPRFSRRHFQEYFITHLPTSSLHPDSGSGSSAAFGPNHHKLPRDKSIPSDGSEKRTPAALPGAATMPPASRDMTVVRIPIKSAKHHFGASVSRGSRPYNEDTFQAGTIEIPAFARRRPVSLTRSAAAAVGGGGSGSVEEAKVTPAGAASGDPQVFYFGVFDGHGGSECSDFLKSNLHSYIEDGARLFELESSLKKTRAPSKANKSARKEEETQHRSRVAPLPTDELRERDQQILDSVEIQKPSDCEPASPPDLAAGEKPPSAVDDRNLPPDGDPVVKQSTNIRRAEELEKGLVLAWKELVGGYYKRFKPEFFSRSAGGQGHTLERALNHGSEQDAEGKDTGFDGIGLETVLEYAFLKADYDFVSAQAGKQADEDPVIADRAINDHDILGQPSQTHPRNIGGPRRFKGGSTCSIALISTPTPSPYWHPSSPSTIVTAHVGDTRILLCNTATGAPLALTSNHHPSLPQEANRLRRYAATFVTDSFGEERMSGLANTRAFGDMASKRIGVSAEPEIRRFDLGPAEYSFLVLVSDGVSGPLSDQEIVDIVKEAKTPEQAARDVVGFATEVAEDADNATALVVRLGGWERRSEGGLGSLGTRELREWRKQESNDPRARRQ